MSVPNTVPNGAEARVVFSIAGEAAVNVYGFQTSGALVIDAALAENVESGIKAAWTANMASLCPASTEMLHVGLRDLRQANLPEHFGTSAAAVGTSIGDPLPSKVALCLTSRTALAGRSFRGRTYLGGFDELQNNATGQASAATIAGALAYIRAWQTTLNGLGLSYAVITHAAEHQTIVKNTFHADGTQTTKIMSDQSAKVGAANRVTLIESRDPNWETQRRRGNGRGQGQVAALRGTASSRVVF